MQLLRGRRGPKGIQGKQGIQGPQGDQGDNGNDGRSFDPGYPAWHERTLKAIKRIAITLAIMTVLLAGIGAYQLVGAAQRSTEIQHLCHATQVLTGITKQKVVEAATPKTQEVIAKINFPGLTHAEFEHLVKVGNAKESKHLQELEGLQRESCD